VTQDNARDLPLPELLRRFAEQTGTLVRQEIELARVELSDKAKAYGQCAGLAGAAALLALGAFGALTATLIAAIALVLETWAAALIVTIVYTIVAVLLIQRVRAQIKTVTPLPKQAIETTKEDIEWAKTRATSARQSK
jgi:uncharacterized membrane protein YqjE